MKILNDFLPIILFFIAFKLYGIYTATMVAIAAAVFFAAIFWLKYRRLEKMHIINLAVITLFGGATLLLQDETFIKWKPTVINGLLAVVFLGSQFIGKKTVVERMMGGNIDLPMDIWARLNLSWVLFFILSAVTNIYVAYNFDTDTWVDFKLFGMLGMTLLFLIAQGVFISRYSNASRQTQEP